MWWSCCLSCRTTAPGSSKLCLRIIGIGIIDAEIIDIKIIDIKIIDIKIIDTKPTTAPKLTDPTTTESCLAIIFFKPLNRFALTQHLAQY